MKFTTLWSQEFLKISILAVPVTHDVRYYKAQQMRQNL